jgi:DNA replication protein DnaC
VTDWRCRLCGEDQVAFGPLPADHLCHICHDAQACMFSEADAGIPVRYRNLTRESWSAHFRRPWPAAVERWTGKPHWVALWGPTGTGKTSLATILLAEHLRTGRRGRWISGPELAHRIQSDFTTAWDFLNPYLVTSLLVLDKPLSGAAADWYFERLLLITRTRDENGLLTVVTSQLLPELYQSPSSPVAPPLLSRWLSGIRISEELDGEDVRLQERRG